jgi:GT2 family glycosyltransferase
MPVPLVSVNILAQNHRPHLARCLDSVLAQTYAPLEITFIDNGSADDAVEFVRQAYPRAYIIANGKNLGYSGGHNIGIRATSGQYVLLLNPDVRLTPSYTAEAVRALECADNVGMVTGKLLLMDEAGNPTTRLDSAGVVLDRYRKNRERGHGQEDLGQYERVEDVFGAMGAAPLYRRAMLEDIRIGEEILDEDFFAYREEVDLAWRARLRGWRCLYTPAAIAYHVHAYRPENRNNRPAWQRRMQFRNRYLLMLKNDTLGSLLRHTPYVFGYELAALGYALLVDRHLLSGYWNVLQLLPKMMRKRRYIQSHRLVSGTAMLHWLQ